MFTVKELWDWVRSILIAVMLALLIRSFVIEILVVDGDSMLPTLQHGERVIVNRFVYYFNEPEPEEIAVFKYTSSRDFIKRVIGVPGDKIKIENNNIYRNGEIVSEEYFDLVDSENNKVESYGPVEVPQDKYFVLGDNLDSSKDSRSESVGFVSEERFKGRAFMVFWPFSNLRIL